VKKTSHVLGIVSVLLWFVAASLSAHHAWPVNNQRLVTVKGTVLEFTWSNPHPMITLEVKNDAGAIEKWSIGGPAITRMEANGWGPTTLKAGEVITGSGYQFSDGQKIIRLETVTLANGREMRVYGR
jgi:hypothetical protein